MTSLVPIPGTGTVSIQMPSVGLRFTKARIVPVVMRILVIGRRAAIGRFAFERAAFERVSIRRIVVQGMGPGKAIRARGPDILWSRSDADLGGGDPAPFESSKKSQDQCQRQAKTAQQGLRNHRQALGIDETGRQVELDVFIVPRLEGAAAEERKLHGPDADMEQDGV